MDDHPAQLTEFGNLLLIGVVGVLLVLLMLFLGKFIAPKNPNPEKNSTYECGEEAIGSSWIQFNPRFYVIALIFLLFDVELIFIFPWATIFGRPELIALDPRWGWFTLVEMAIFIGILIVGLVYVWRKGDLDWIKPKTTLPHVMVNIPKTAYDNLNNQQYTIRPFESNPTPAPISETGTAGQPTKPAFKPRFRKPGIPPSP